MGGDLMEGNLLGGYVRETRDHASFNSWDRQSWFFQIDGKIRFQPEVTQITRNLILNKDYVYESTNSDWCIDHVRGPPPPFQPLCPLSPFVFEPLGCLLTLAPLMCVGAHEQDDASSFYYDSLNVLVWGAHKWRDGVNKSYVSNL